MRTAEDFDVPASVTRQLSRRSVIRAGAHAAWVVPAVQVVGAAPAFAACSCPPGANNFTFNVTATWRPQSKNSDKYVLDFSGTIVNNSGVTVHGLTVCLVVPSGWTGVHSHSTRQNTNNYWTDTYDSGNQNIVVFTTTATVANGLSWSFANVSIREENASKWVKNTTVTLIASSVTPSGKNARGAVTSTN